MMLVGSVVHNQIHDHIDAPLLRLMYELNEIAARAVPRIYPVVVADVVAIVEVRRRLEWRKPHSADTERLKIFQTASQPFKIAHPVAICIHKGFQVKTVDDGVFVPKVFNHESSQVSMFPCRNHSSLWRLKKKGRSTAGGIAPAGSHCNSKGVAKGI
jgi:hypothetical protein